MKVLMINVVCGIRSTGKICTNLALALEEQGHTVKIAYGRETVPAQYERFAIRIGNDTDVKLHGLKARLFDKAGFGSTEATKKFIEWVKEYDPDVIHMHNIHGYFLNLELFFNYLKSSGKRVIWTLHDCWSFTGHTAYCDAFNCEKWENGCGSCPGLKEYPKSFIDDSKNNWIKKRDTFIGVNNLTIVSCSEWVDGLVSRSFLKDYPHQIIVNGVNTDSFYPIESDFKKKHGLENKFVLLAVSTAFDDMKGYSDFIRLANILDERFQIVLVGLTAKQIEKLPANIIGIERTNSVQQLAEIYSASDLLVNMTYCDTYALVNVEAALCGTPAACYNTGGCKESIGDRGILVEKGNVEAMKEAVEHFIDHPLSFEIDREQFDTARVIKQYLQLYNK